MDHERFAAVTKALAGAGSRRAAVRAAVAVAAGGALGALGTAAPDAGAAFCRLPRQRCSRDSQCCAHRCQGRRCGCKPKGEECYQNFGLACCSKTCSKGTCK